MTIRTRHAIASILLVVASTPGCALFGPCDGRSFDFFGLGDASGDKFVDLCPLIATACGDQPVPSPFTFCGLDFTTACGCFNEFLTRDVRATEDPRGNPGGFTYGNVSAISAAAGNPAVEGLSPGFQASFTIAANQLQTFSGSITLPDGFGFKGFSALGPPGTQIGAYGLDINLDGDVDFTIPILARDTDHAFADVDRDGEATDGLDPTIEHTAGSHVFTTSLPFGGDGSIGLFFGPRALRIRVGLFPGIVLNPPDGNYPVTGIFTSVDPETGGASNGTGQAPSQFMAPMQQLTIAASPLASVDHFVCYKTKLSKGKLCADTAPANAGAACVVEEDCGGTTDATFHCLKNKPAKGIVTALGDAFENKDFTVRKPLTLCVPADKNDEGIVNSAAHLRGYAIKEASGPKHAKVSGVAVVNQLGTIAIDTTKASTVLVATAKGPLAPVPPLPAGSVDHYKCYGAKFAKKRCAQDPSRTCKRDLDCDVAGPCLLKFAKGLQVTASDQLTSARLLDVRKPTRFCLPTSKDGVPPTHGAALACYQVKPAKGEPKHAKTSGLHLTNSIGLRRERTDTVKEDELCVPTLLPM